MKIAHKLVLEFLVIVSLVGIAGYLAVDSSQKALENSIGKGLIALSTAVLRSLDKEIYNRIETFEEYTKDQLLIESVINENNKFKKLADIQSYINQQDKKWIATPPETVSPFMQELLNNSLSKELQEKIEFYEKKYGYKIFSEVFVTNRYGAIAGLTNRTTDYRQDDESWWQEARLKDSYIPDTIELDESAGNVSSITIAQRIENENGEFIGVLKAVLNIKTVADLMNKETSIQSEFGMKEVSLFTRDGKIIYSNEYNATLDASLIFPAFVFDGKDSGIFTHSIDSDRKDELVIYVHSKRNKNHKGFGWIMVMELESAEAFAPVVTLKNTIMFIVISITAFAALMSFLIFFPISRAISRLKDATVEVSQGNLPELEGFPKDETGDLAKSFNKMSIQLNAYQKNNKIINNELIATNEELLKKSQELENKSQHAAILNELIQVMQACPSTEEALTVIAQFGQQIFPGDSAVLYLFNESRNLIEAKAQWGNNIPQENVFTPEDCWALREGKPYVVMDSEAGMKCQHVEKEFAGSYLCIPMLAQSVIAGLLHLRTEIEINNDKEMESKKIFVSNFAELVAMSLQNLKLRESLRNLSIHDPLTGLFNVRYMEEALEKELKRAERKKESIGVVMCDIDHFKRFNDTFGHDAGDYVLKEISMIFQKNMRASDTACRYGGEEFLLVLPDCTEKMVFEKAELLRESIKNLNLIHQNQSLGIITMSFGVATFPDHGLTRNDVVKAADNALYSAKKSGRDRVVVFKVKEVDE